MQVKGRGRIREEGIRGGRGQSGVEGSAAPLPGGQSWRRGHQLLERCQSPDLTRISGDLWGPQRHGVPSTSSGGFRTSRHLLHRPRHPSPSHGAEVTRSWGRRPGRRRDLARPTERQESVKEARSPSAKTASLSQSLARQGWGRVKGGCAPRKRRLIGSGIQKA